MKILFDHQIFLAQRYGGISRYFINLIRELAAEPGCEILVFAGLYANRYLARERAELGVRIIGCRLPWNLGHSRLVSFIDQLWFRVVLRWYRPDIYHPTYYKTLAPGAPVRRVLTVHDMTNEVLPHCIPLTDPTSERKREAVARADAVLCVSRNTQRDLERILGTPTEKCRVTYESGALNGQPRTERPLPDPYLLFVGARGRYKNAAVLLRTLAANSPLRQKFRVVFFGGGPLTADEKSVLQAQGLGDRVLQTEGGDDDLATWYAHAFALVYPSLYEGFGIPPLEAMQCGCPVIASSSSCLPEVIGDAGLLFHPEDEKALANALRSLDGNDGLRDQLVARGRERHRLFTWKRCAAETLDAYRSVMSAQVHGE